MRNALNCKNLQVEQMVTDKNICSACKRLSSKWLQTGADGADVLKLFCKERVCSCHSVSVSFTLPLRQSHLAF